MGKKAAAASAVAAAAAGAAAAVNSSRPVREIWMVIGKKFLSSVFMKLKTRRYSSLARSIAIDVLPK